MAHSYQPESDDVQQIVAVSSRTRPDDFQLATASRQLTDPVFHDPPLLSSDKDMILSPSPPPLPVQQAQSQSPAPGTDTTPSNPQVASLKTIFPDFDEAVILSVLESTDNDHDRALDVLLGMNDPSFVPPVPSQPPRSQPAPTADGQRVSQEALDEQLARRLAFEEEQAARAWQPQGMQGQTAYEAYQLRRGARWGSQSPSQGQLQGPGGRDTMAEFQEGFNRIAESGKKTFTSIVSRVKAKMQEFEQGQGWSGYAGPSSSATPNQPSAQGSYYSSYAPSGEQGGPGASTQPPQSQWQRSQSLPARGPSPTWTPSRANTQSLSASSPPRSGVLRAPSASESAQSVDAQQPSFYDPNAQGYDLYGNEDDAPITLHDITTPAAAVPAASATKQNSAPLSLMSPSTPPPVSDSASVRSDGPPSYKSGVSSPNAAAAVTTPPIRSFSPTSAGSATSAPSGTGITSPPRTAAGGSVDFSKLGLLPKRPISLVRPQSPPGAAGVTAPRIAPTHSESSTDEHGEPEYVENPFEDRT